MNATTETTLAAKVCDHRPMPGGSTLREVLTAANLHANYLTDDVRAAVEDAVAGALGDAYDCTRTWAAWQHGTMSADDFHPIVADADRVAEIAGAAIDAMGVHILPGEPAVSDPMSPEEAATVLAKHNAWRRGGNGPALDSKVIGTAIDTAVEHLQALSKRAVNCIDLPAGWKITREGDRLCVKRPDGVTSEWNGRPATNGTGMYDLCMDLIAGAREIPGTDLRPVRSLIACAEELMERTEQPPKANCTCHLAPPCGDCTDWGGLRETRANLQEAIDAAEAAFPGVANG